MEVRKNVHEVISKMKRVELQDEGAGKINGVEGINNVAVEKDSDKEANEGILDEIGSNVSNGEVASSDGGK